MNFEDRIEIPDAHTQPQNMEEIFGQAVDSVEKSKRWMEISSQAKEELLKEFDEAEISDLFDDPDFREKSTHFWNKQTDEDLLNGLVTRAKEELHKRKLVH
jgi:hypothetical protein